MNISQDWVVSELTGLVTGWRADWVTGSHAECGSAMTGGVDERVKLSKFSCL